MKESLLILTLLALASCGGRGQKKHADTLNDLRKHYLSSCVSYQNDIGMLGVGGSSIQKVIRPCRCWTRSATGNPQSTIPDLRTQEYVVSLINKPDYHIFYIAVKAVHANHYEIHLNEISTAYVSKDEFNFYDWPDLLMKIPGIEAVAEVCTDRRDPASAVKFNKTTNFKVQSVDGDWLRAKEELNDGARLGETDYWTKWRKDRNLTVDLYFLM